ncbi:hypothetical protein F5Y14DRAFT_453804 [Nemania sp. NC0429]|nr:hypothetical protein F5Y14DRAFT_453804 [Nemania sp. NC0429]
MQFSTATLAAILSASTVFAAPVAIPNWTLTSVKRVCDKADTSCTWSFGINPNNGAAATAVKYVIKGSPASQTDLTVPTTFGAYTVTAGWSGQFGAGNGFTTLAVANNAKHQIAWPAYTDAELASGKAVTPDKSWTVAQL